MRRLRYLSTEASKRLRFQWQTALVLGHLSVEQLEFAVPGVQNSFVTERSMAWKSPRRKPILKLKLNVMIHCYPHHSDFSWVCRCCFLFNRRKKETSCAPRLGHLAVTSLLLFSVSNQPVSPCFTSSFLVATCRNVVEAGRTDKYHILPN